MAVDAALFKLALPYSGGVAHFSYWTVYKPLPVFTADATTARGAVYEFIN